MAKKICILALIVVVCTCSGINPSKEKLLGNLQDGNFGDDIQDRKNDTDGFSDIFKDLDDLRKMIDGCIEEYKNKKLDKVKKKVKVNFKNDFSNVSDNETILEGIIEMAESMGNKIISEKSVRTLERITKAVDDMIIKHMEGVVLFPGGLEKLKELKKIIVNVLERPNLRTRSRGAEFKEGNRLESISPVSSSL
jgi:hypothetical protein